MINEIERYLAVKAEITKLESELDAIKAILSPGVWGDYVVSQTAATRKSLDPNVVRQLAPDIAEAATNETVYIRTTVKKRK